MGTSQAVTREIRVDVESSYVAERSQPLQSLWFFAYRIRITNEGEETVQLLSRHWLVKDAEGSVEEVEGPGVVGEQPILEPGEAFEYVSACPLSTAYGHMQGSYDMVTASGEHFEVEIAPFSLEQPYALH